MIERLATLIVSMRPQDEPADGEPDKQTRQRQKRRGAMK